MLYSKFYKSCLKNKFHDTPVTQCFYIPAHGIMKRFIKRMNYYSKLILF